MGLKPNPSDIKGVPGGKGGDVSRSHGYSSSPLRDVLQRDRSLWDPQAKVGVITSTTPSLKTNTNKYMKQTFFMKLFSVISPQTPKSNNGFPSQGRVMGKSSLDAQKKGSYHT